MKITRTTFFKINILVVLLLIPIIILYGLSNRTSVNVVEEEIKSRNLNRLSLIQNQIDSSIDNLTSYLYTLSADPDVMRFRNIEYYSDYRQLEIKNRLMEKMMLYKEQSNWASDIRLYNVRTKQAISSDFTIYNEYHFQKLHHPKWGIESTQNHHQEGKFVKHLYQPFDITYDHQLASIIYEVRFPVSAILPLLDQLKADAQSDPFLYLPGGFDPIVSSNANKTLINTLLDNVDIQKLDTQGSLTVKMAGQNYLMSYVRSKTMDWVLIDYVPLKVVLSPIIESNNLFYGSVSLLLLLSFVASMLLYRNVHRPIRRMMKSMHSFRQGHYDVRFELKQNDEFSIMFQSFNDMAGQIQHLIEEVLEGKIIANEAKLKLLQSQINPHFLYNCLNFIKNMAKMGNDEAVEAMALHLGKYYRYIQRSDEEWVTLHDEFQLISSLLEIHAMRLQNLTYHIEIDPQMEAIKVPRLLIQPIVENAIVHGFRHQTEACIVQVKATLDDSTHHIVVEDNGSGLSNKEIEQLSVQLQQPDNEETSSGLWNVNQRLIHQFGDGAGIDFSQSSYNGLKVHIYWQRK